MQNRRKSCNLRHTAKDFWDIYQTSRCVVECRRAQFFALISEGRNISEVAHITKYSRVTLYALMRRYQNIGLNALKDGRHSNKGAPKFNKEEKEVFKPPSKDLK